MRELLARKSDALKSIARHLGGDYNVEVKYDPLGMMATNGKVISLPLMSDESYEKYEKFIVGGVFHETGHIVHTDFQKYQDEKNPIRLMFMNALDDHRVDTFRKEDYRSAEYELRKLYEYAEENNRAKFKDKNYDELLEKDASEMLWAVTAATVLKLNGEDISWFPKRAVEISDKTDDILEEYKHHLIRERIEGTEKAHEYAIKMEKRLEDILTKPPPPPKSNSGEEGEDGDETKDKKDGKANSKGAKVKKKKKGDDEETKVTLKKNKDMYDRMTKCEPKDIHEDIKREMQELVLNHTEKNLEHHVPHPKAVEADLEITPTYKDSSKVQQTYSRVKDEVQREIESMRGKLLSVLMAQKRLHYLPDSENGEIDIAALYSLRAGNEKVFERRVMGKKLNTAVEILIDCSGSMATSEKYYGAIKASVACGETLELLKIPFEVTGFTTNYSGLDCSGFTNAEFESYNRFEPLTHFVFKEFNENFSTTKYRLMEIRPNENNGDPESVWWAACRLSRRREERKILIVMSDGHPAMSRSCDIRLLEKELKKVVRKITHAGIEVYGIGIYDDAPKHFYPEWSLISKGKDDIASAVYGCLSKKLLNGGTHGF